MFIICRNNFDITKDENILFEYGSERKVQLKKYDIQKSQEVCKIKNNFNYLIIISNQFRLILNHF